MNADLAWQSVLGQLQMEMTRASFDTWVRDTRPVSYEHGVLTVGVRNAYARDWLESRLASTVSRLLIGILNSNVAVDFIVSQSEERTASSTDPEPDAASNEQASLEARPRSTSLNPRYTFDTYVVGAGNRLAHAACQAVAEKPARAYNPLFLYGGVGLGKTHLLHAIGNACHARGLHVLYVSSEEFTNDMINAIRSQNTAAFRDKYRTIDVLLIDDIQFIAGKESTQEEFFHTFNTLHGNGKQIVMTSDRPPKSMITLEERLRSRFEWGLIADIQPPDLETRTAILRDKAEHMAAGVPSEVIDFIARQVQSNIRELEGALNRVIAYARLRGNTLTVEIAGAALADLMSRPSTMTISDILSTVANYYSISMDDLLGRGRNKELVHPRQVAMYLAREELQTTLPQIGEALGGRDHTTVMYSVDKITQTIDSDDSLRREVLAIRELLYNRTTTPART